jgi:hypothetical protein
MACSYCFQHRGPRRDRYADEDLLDNEEDDIIFVSNEVIGSLYRYQGGTGIIGAILTLKLR